MDSFRRLRTASILALEVETLDWEVETLTMEAVEIHTLGVVDTRLKVALGEVMGVQPMEFW